ncbi:hypothetical protein Tco_0406380, partial [Tanacetum coccineum]
MFFGSTILTHVLVPVYRKDWEILLDYHCFPLHEHLLELSVLMEVEYALK